MHQTTDRILHLLDLALDVVLPGDCAGCLAPGPMLCDGCRSLLLAAPSVHWPTPSPPALPTPFAVADYDGPVRAALLAYKEHGMTALRRPLAAALSQSVRAALAGRDPDAVKVALVPMPSSAASNRRRGDDVVCRLAKSAAAGLRQEGVRVTVIPALRLSRRVADSAGLSSASRRANLSGAMALRGPALARCHDYAIVVVDDVLTTGATLAEASRALRAAGLSPHAAAVVAATRRRNRQQDCPMRALATTV